LRTSGSKASATLHANQILNAIFPCKNIDICVAIHGQIPTEEGGKHLDFAEFEAFLRCFFGVCFYGCGVSNWEKHPIAYPILITEIEKLLGSSLQK